MNRYSSDDVQLLLSEARSAGQEGRHAVARHRYEAALRRIGRSAEPTLASSILRWIGRTWLDEGVLDAAEDAIVAALASAEAQDDSVGTAHAVNCLAIVHQRQGRLEEAERLYWEAAGLARETGETKLRAMVHQNLGTIATIRGEFDDARLHFEAGLAIYRSLGLDEHLPALLNNLAMLNTDCRRYDEAEHCYALALDSARTHGSTSTHVSIQVNRIELLIARGDFERARRACDQAYEMAQGRTAERWIGEIHKHYGTIYRCTGRYRLAEHHLATAARIAREAGDVLLQAEAFRERGEVSRAEDRYPATLSHLERAHRLFSELRARRDLDDVDQQIRSLEEFFLEIVHRWGESIERKDRYTAGHCERVAEYACELARSAGFDPRTLVWFRMGAVLHDVGKVVVPSQILNKRGLLTEEERRTMMLHARAGADLLSEIDFPWDVRPMVRHHHEQWCGGGYPDGLRGTEIPLAARILCIADVFDALTTERSYRPALSEEAALEIMQGDAGHVFDPDYLPLFVKLVRQRAFVDSFPRPEVGVAVRPVERNGTAAREPTDGRESGNGRGPLHAARPPAR